MRDTVLLYTNIKEPVDELTDEQAGKLFKAILAYQTDNDVVLDGLLKVVFLQIKQQIDYNNDRFDDKSKKRSEAGKKGMEKRWNKNNNDNNVITNDNNVNNVITSDNKNNYNDNDNDNDINKNNKGKKPKDFTPPTLEEIQAYIKERGSNVDAKRFFDYYEQGGWKDSSGKPVRNWKQKMIAVWEKDKSAQPKPQNSFCNFKQNDIDYDELAKKIYAN